MLISWLRMAPLVAYLIGRCLVTFQYGGNMCAPRSRIVKRTGSRRLCCENICLTILLRVSSGWTIIIFAGIQSVNEQLGSWRK